MKNKINKWLLIIFLFLFTTSINGYELEDRLKVLITGKIAKFITWQDNNSSEFVIGVYKNQLNDFFENIYNNTKIKSKKVKVKYIEKIEDLSKVKILYISQATTSELSSIFKYVKNKNIVTISDIRGFTQKGGTIQLYSKNQKLKIRINLDNAKKENIKIKSSLLRISDVIRESK